MRPQRSMGFFEQNIFKLKNADKNTFLLSCWSKGDAGTHFEKDQRSENRSRFRSINAHDEHKRLKLKWIGYFAKIHEPLCGANLKWEDFSWELQGEPGESQPTESTDDADFWSIQGDLFYRHHNETSSSTPCAERRNIPYSIEIHWCHKIYLHWSGRHARETCRWLLECRFEQKLVRFVRKVMKGKPPKGYI